MGAQEAICRLASSVGVSKHKVRASQGRSTTLSASPIRGCCVQVPSAHRQILRFLCELEGGPREEQHLLEPERSRIVVQHLIVTCCKHQTEDKHQLSYVVNEQLVIFLFSYIC